MLPDIGLLDKVKLLCDLPEHGLHTGDMGMVTSISGNPPTAYDVQFGDDLEAILINLRPFQVQKTECAAEKLLRDNGIIGGDNEPNPN